MDTLFTPILQNLPAFILLILGFVLVLVEMHIPGFGAPAFWDPEPDGGCGALCQDARRRRW